MSLILQALNRSQQERGSDPERPGLAAPHYVDHGLASGRDRRLIALWAALAVALVVIAWLVMANTTASSSSPVPTATATLAPADSDSAPLQASVPKPIAAAPEHAVQPPPQSRVTAAAVTAVESPPPRASVIDDAAISALYQQQQVASAPQSRPQPPAPVATPAPEPTTERPRETEQLIDIEALILGAREDLENAKLAPHTAPFLAALSQRTKDGIPTIYYRQHDYSDRPGQSSVVLNGKTVRGGGAVGGGVKLEQILPYSIVLSHGDVQFRLRALNSWINL